MKNSTVLDNAIVEENWETSKKQIWLNKDLSKDLRLNKDVYVLETEGRVNGQGNLQSFNSEM